MGSVILHRGLLLLKHVGLPHRRPFSTLHLTGSALPHREVILVENVGLAQRAFSEGVPRGVERLQVIETPTHDVAVRRIVSVSVCLSLYLSSACAQPQPLHIICFEKATSTSSLKNPCTSGVKALWCFTLFGERRPLLGSSSADCLCNLVWSARNS